MESFDSSYTIIYKSSRRFICLGTTTFSIFLVRKSNIENKKINIIERDMHKRFIGFMLMIRF